MPNKQAAMKALRQAKKAAVRHAELKTKLENLEKRIKKLVATKKQEEAKKMAALWQKACDKAAKANVFKKTTASRLKSRLMKAVNSIKK